MMRQGKSIVINSVVYVWGCRISSQNSLAEKWQRPVTRIVILRNTFRERMWFGAQSHMNSKMRHVHAIRATILHFAYPDHTDSYRKNSANLSRSGMLRWNKTCTKYIRVHDQQCKHVWYFDNTLHFAEADSIKSSTSTRIKSYDLP